MIRGKLPLHKLYSLFDFILCFKLIYVFSNDTNELTKVYRCRIHQLMEISSM